MSLLDQSVKKLYEVWNIGKDQKKQTNKQTNKKKQNTEIFCFHSQLKKLHERKTMH